MMVQLGELSAGRQALEAAEMAPGTLPTLQALRDPSDALLVLVKTSRGSCSSLSQPPHWSWMKGYSQRICVLGEGARQGMTTDHLRPLLDNVRDLHMLFLVGEQLATGKAPHEVVEIVRMSRLTALTKPNGGIRGIVSGDVVRRLVSRTIAQQVGEVVEAGTAPVQYALSTRSGSECVRLTPCFARTVAPTEMTEERTISRDLSLGSIFSSSNRFRVTRPSS